MKLLLDQCVPAAVVDPLAAAGHDAVHVSAYAMSQASDAEVLERARSERRVLVSADTDFGALLASRGSDGPSVVLYRRHGDRRPAAQAEVLVRSLRSLERDLAAGAIAVLGDAGNRIHRLPVERGAGREPAPDGPLTGRAQAPAGRVEVPPWPGRAPGEARARVARGGRHR